MGRKKARAGSRIPVSLSRGCGVLSDAEFFLALLPSIQHANQQFAARQTPSLFMRASFGRVATWEKWL